MNKTNRSNALTKIKNLWQWKFYRTVRTYVTNAGAEINKGTRVTQCNNVKSVGDIKCVNQIVASVRLISSSLFVTILNVENWKEKISLRNQIEINNNTMTTINYWKKLKKHQDVKKEERRIRNKNNRHEGNTRPIIKIFY